MRNLKRIIALAATFALTLTSTAFASNYSDVEDNSVYAEAVETLSKLNIFTGDDADGDGIMSFRPEDSITRAEFAALIARIQGFEGTAMSQTETVFNDVPATHWASGYIAQAANQGIVNGYGDGNFGPEDNVKYEEAIKMIMATLGYEPYAKQEGGYPTGWLTAATRYNVTKGVSNTTTGVAATRGTIAQLLNNAIDTALMGQAKWSNGGVVEYVIYDGVTNAYKTLMSEYLGVTKLKGKVIANSITSLDSFQTIDTTKDPEVKVVLTDNFNTTNDDFESLGTRDFKVADSDAEDFLGQSVIFYVKENTKDDSYEVISMAAESGKNNKVEFSIDKFDSAASNYIKYMRNDSDRNATKITIQSNPSVIYNNVAGVKSYDALFTNGNALIQKDGTVGGKVVAYDTDDVTGYDVIFVEVAATGVVDEVINGKITFKNSVGLNNYANSISKIVVDPTDEDVIVNITKDGKEISVDEIKEWDVLSIVTAAKDSTDVYNVEVLAGTSAVEGSISATSASTTSDTGYAYRINNTKYDVAAGAYKCDNLKVGNSGMFYVDAYGKIVAYNKDASSTGKANYNYAYVMGVSDEEDNFGKGNVQLKLLTANQGVAIWNVATSVKINDDTYKVEDQSAEIARLVNVGDVITYTLSGDKVKTITTPNFYEDEFQSVTLNGYEYDADGLRFGKRDVDEDTVVLLYDTADPDDSMVSTIAALVDEETYSGALAFADSSDYEALDLLVITDYSGKFGAASSFAVISDVYESQNEAEEDIYTIEFVMNGETKTANTTSKVYSNIDGVFKLNQGDVIKVKMNAAGEISDAMMVVDFAEGVRDKYDSNKKAVAITEKISAAAKTAEDEEYIIAPVADYKTSTKNLTLADGRSFKLSNANNVIVIDPSRNNMVSAGSIGDIEYDKYLKYATSNIENSDDEVIAYAGATDGLRDYVVIRVYEDKVEDVVIVKAYDFGSLDYEYDASEK